MKKMNNKGFAISTMLYGLLILIVLVVSMILSIMAFNRKNSREFSETVVDGLEKYYTNQNIMAAYTYDSSTCVTGEESTCKQILITSSDRNIPAGTIIKYKVNDTDVVTFHVMYDSASTITMQSQKNIVNNTEWINASDYARANRDGTVCSHNSCNDEGPITALVALEKATESWKYVNNQKYTMGTTVFRTNAFTGSNSYGTATSNIYTLPERTAKARMITLQEVFAYSCGGSSSTCPKWMYNYLYNSKSYGGTVSDNEKDSVTGNYKQGYWTMTAYSSNGASYIFAWVIFNNGAVYPSNAPYCFTSSAYMGARAVVVINK